jgi:VIT1/CCC1 family predicted Fe2+/Mn2+ transporter
MSPHQSLQTEHTQEAIAHRLAAATKHNYVGDFILGAVDGAVTTFAIVAGAAGAGLSNSVALVLGLANVLADGLSMAAGNYLRARSDLQMLQRIRRMEEFHIDTIPDGEREEIRQIYKAKGFDSEVLEQIVQIITDDRQRWIDTMLTEEWGLQLQPPSPWRAGLATMVAFVAAGAIPLIPALFWISHRAGETFLTTTLITGAAFFGIGLVRGRVADQRPSIAGLETLFIGGSAALVAYFVGRLLERFTAA